MLPTPKLYVFYNGTEHEVEEKILYLSKFFTGEGDIEVKVRMVNINYGHNEKLLKTCRQLGEYSWFIAEIRYNTNVLLMNLSDAIDSAIMKMPEDFSIKELIVKHQMEVKGMLFSEAETEFEMNKLKNQITREITEEIARNNYIEGHKDGYIKGCKEQRGKERDHIISLLLENGVDKRLIELIKNDSYLKEQPE